MLSISIQNRFMIVGSAELLSILSISIRYRYDYVSLLLDKLYCCRYRRHRIDIDTISSCNCWINCIAVDVYTISSCTCWINCVAVDIETIFFRDCRISCSAVDIIDIDTISFHDCWISYIAVDIIDIDSISIRYRFVIVG